MTDVHTISSQMINLVGRTKVIPIVQVEETRHAVPLAETLFNAGISIIEVVLRTPNSLEAIREIVNNTSCMVGAGSIITLADAVKAKEAGASFAVSPGSTFELVDACIDMDFPYLPGAVTGSEMMKLADKGITFLKFFPAEPSGGIPYLKSIMGPLPHLRFCPTGGVCEKNFIQYLNLGNIPCVGGSWIAPPELINEAKWTEVSANAQRSLQMLAENVK